MLVTTINNNTIYSISTFPSFDITHLNSLLSQKKKEIETVYNDLHFENEAVLDIAFDILASCFDQGKFNIQISKTGDHELLMFTYEHGDYKNIIIDEDGDIEYLFIPSERERTFNERFEFINNINPEELAGKL